MSESEDYRFDHIKKTTLKLLNVSDKDWAELIWKEENQAVVKDFLENSTTIFLLIYLDQDRKLLLSSEFPSPRHISPKMAYFLKKNSVVTSEKHKQEIMFGSVWKLPLNQYKKLFEMVICPMFSNSSNNKRWPVEIANDIISHVEDFKKILTYHVGVAQSKTVLVIPETAKLLKNYDVNKMSGDQIDWEMVGVINAVTDMVCDWIPIINEVLAVTSESILLKIQQGPESELQFWKNHKENLEFIQEQLSDPLIEKMICALDKTGSPHCSLFRNLLQKVAEALTEANEVNESLSTMSDQLKKLEACEFIEIKEDISETVKIMTSSWISSKYFSKVPSRISVLIQKCCFFLIEKVGDYLTPSELFKEDVLEMKMKVEICIETLNDFLQSYTDCQENYNEDNKVYPWVFPDERAFNSFKIFLERLNKVYEIFKASLLYCSIPEYKFFGVVHAPFKLRLSELSELFKEYYQVFVESTYNPLDLKSHEFLEDYNTFSTKVFELDCKLGTALFQACLSCTTSEESYKFMKIVQTFLNRPEVNLEFKNQVSSLEKNIYMEILDAKESYDNSLAAFESDSQVIYKNLPNMSAKIQWTIDLQRKLTFLIDSFRHLQENYNKDDTAELIFKAYEEIQELLQKYQVEIFNTWETALNFLKEELDQPLFSDYEQSLSLNFAPKVIVISREIQYINARSQELLPPDALPLYKSLESAFVAQFLLACTLRWYNDLNENLTDFEIMLIKDDWDKICEDLKRGLDEKWTKDDLREYSENVYKIAKSLFEKINQSRKNVREIQEFIETWNKSPVFIRETPDSIVNFEMFMTPRMRQQIYDLNKTSTNMYRIMEENMQIFECNPEMDKWENYVLYLDSIIETGLKDSVQCSLQYLAENTNRFNKKLAPFCKIRMILEDDIAFIPSLDRNQLGSFFALFEAVIERIYAPASEIRRLANPEMDYSEAIVKDNDINNLKDQVIQHIESGINNTLAHSRNYQIYSDIWLQIIDEVLEDFILYGPLPETKSDEEAEIQAAGVLLEMKSPSEEEFKAEITKFQMLQKKIEEIQEEILIESWLILDTASFKESLLSMIRNWSSAYKKKLIELKSQNKLRKDEDDGD